MAGGLTVGEGSRKDAIPRGADATAMTRLAEEDARLRMRLMMTTVPIANARPTQSTTTTMFASVSLPVASV